MPIDKGSGSPDRNRRQFQSLAVGEGTLFGDGLIYDTDDNSLAIDLATVSGLAFSSGDLTIDLRDTTPCLELDATGIGVIIPSSSGLVRTASGLSIDLRDTNPCLELDATGIGATVNSTGGLQLTSTGLSLNDTSGTAFPTSGLYVGKVFFRTDLVELFKWDGTSWLGEVFTYHYGQNTNTAYPIGNFIIRPVGSVTAARPHGYPVLEDCKVIGMQFKSDLDWSGDIELRMGNTILATMTLTTEMTKSATLNIDVDASTSNGMNITCVHSAGSFADGILFVKLCRRITPT